MILLNAHFRYHIRKPRIISEGVKSFIDYKRSLREARLAVQVRDLAYQNKIEDEYLEAHKQEKKKLHFQNEAYFRQYIIQSGYTLNENIKRWKQQDSELNQKLEQHMNNDQLKRINRQRIKKILEHESQNYWFNSQNVDTKLTNETVLPFYMGNSQFYHKLHLQALAYEIGDMDLMENVTSNQKIIKQKNLMLIPLYRQVLKYATMIKATPLQKILKQHKCEINRLNLQKNDKLSPSQKQQKIKRLEKQRDQKILQLSLMTEQKFATHVKENLILLTNLIKAWQNYTSVLSMSSTQMLQKFATQENNKSLKFFEKKIFEQYAKKKNAGFSLLKEEDSQDLEISFVEYLSQIQNGSSFINQNANTTQKQSKMSYIDSLLQDEVSEKEVQQKQVQSQPIVRQTKEKVFDFGMFDEMNTNSTILKLQPASLLKDKTQTTPAIEAFKQIYSSDKQILQLLNQVGQAKIQYQQLLKKILQIA